ncbi:uncharacterized protein LOC128997402 [Macrosteles quadrilineatus]|uniref:uncharacterized protein LOC128997402 n=1 Tax=Macrosteles quadrilineatus TaxID=74068 RepID=UPI0023E1C7EF|nr:uncharacterized protein LOC128997402 [Macrosteles quadrilineatus]
MRWQKFVVIVHLFSNVYGSDLETESHYEKCKEFEKEMGKPNIYYDENQDLVMNVKLYRGNSNRVIDSGMNSVGIQLKGNEDTSENEALVKFLSTVIGVKESSLTVFPGEKSFQRSVKVKGSAITAYELIDKLVAALEVTAKEEPSALCVTDPEELADVKEAQDYETREFDWTNKNL